MGARSPLETRVIWAFWLASGVIAAGGVVPLLLAGTSGRISGVIIPFWVAAIALAGCALLQQRGRPVATLLYFVAGLAVVYGILSMLAVPLRLAVVGTCPPSPAQCAPGFEQPLTNGESTGIGFAIGMGIVGILVGFFGLVVLFRRLGKSGAAAPATPSTPPVRRIPPVQTSPAEPAAVSSEPPAPAEPTPAPTESAAEPMAELPAPVEELELPAPVDELELPAHVSEEAPELGEAAPPAGAN